MKNLYILESEKNRILKLHKSFLLEDPTNTGGGNEKAIATEVNTPTPPSNPPVATTTISQLQQKLGVVIDGKLGTNTAKAILAKLGITATPTADNTPPPSNPPVAATPGAAEGEVDSSATTQY